MKRCIYFLMGSLLFMGCSEEKTSSAPVTEWVTLAIESEKFIQEAKKSSERGTSWKMMPDSVHSTIEHSLYSGSSGIILFYLELFSHTGDSTYLEEARSGADQLTSHLRDTIYDAEEVGLYTGLAGIGFALTETFKVTKEERYKKAALETIDLLTNSSDQTANGIHWGSITDIVFGSAGIGLYFHYLADELGATEADSLAILVADGLLDRSIQTDSGLRWKFSPDYDAFFDNFSHGTSGVAYFLAQAYRRTKNKKYLEAALAGTEFLDSISNNKGYIPHHLPGGEDLYYLSWCHGPAGTSRLYYVLFEITGEKEWLKKIVNPADHIISEAIHENRTPGYWNNVGKCCGATSMAEYYLWLYNITGNQTYQNYAYQLTQDVINRSTRQDDMIKWLHAENRVSPDEIAAQTGLMQGSAGMGLWFLQLDAHERHSKPLIVLPDQPKIRSIDVNN